MENKRIEQLQKELKQQAEVVSQLVRIIASTNHKLKQLQGDLKELQLARKLQKW